MARPAMKVRAWHLNQLKQLKQKLPPARLLLQQEVLLSCWLEQRLVLPAKRAGGSWLAYHPAAATKSCRWQACCTSHAPALTATLILVLLLC